MQRARLVLSAVQLARGAALAPADRGGVGAAALEAEPVEGEAPPRVRTWKAIRWELQLLPRRQWWLQLREITKIPGESVGNRPGLR